MLREVGKAAVQRAEVSAANRHCAERTLYQDFAYRLSGLFSRVKVMDA